MRSNSESAMLRMPSLFESRNCLLHLWTSLKRKWIQPKFSPMATGCFLNPELRHQEGATSWCSARQNWGTETAFRGPQCAEEMSQKEFWWNSRSLPTRFNILWFATQNWLDWGEVHWDGQFSTGKPLLLPILWRVREMWEKLVYHTEQIRQKCTDEAPIRLPRSTDRYAPSPPWIWKRATWTNSSLSIPKVAFVFFQFLMVAVEWTLVELTINERQLLLCSLNEQHQRTGRLVLDAYSSRYSEWNFDQIFVICCSQIVYSWWRSAATDGVCEQNTLTRHIFLVFHHTHFNVAHGIGSRWLSASRHPCFMRCVCSDLSSTLHFALFTVSLIFLFILLIFIFNFHVGRFGVRFREWGVRHFGRQHPSHIPCIGFQLVYQLQNQTWRGRRFWADHSIIPRRYTFHSKPKFQSFCSNPWRNYYWTSHWGSDLENSWPIWTWNCNSITKWFNTDILCYDIQAKESVRGWNSYSHCRSQIQCRITLWTSESRRKRALFDTVEDNHPGDWCCPCYKSVWHQGDLCGHAFFPAKRLCSHKEPFLRLRGIGKLFLPIHRMEELCQQRSPKWLQDWCHITIKMKDNLTQRFIGTRKGRYCW